MLSFRGQLIPTEIVLSPQTYQKIVDESDLGQEIGIGKDPMVVLNSYFSVPITIRNEDTDVIIAKELHPNPCPTCGRRIPFLREMIERVESRSIKRIRCPLGHRYEGEIRIYYLNIFHTERSETNEIHTCPQCGSDNMQYLSKTDIFCLDCEWDNLDLIGDA